MIKSPYISIVLLALAGSAAMASESTSVGMGQARSISLPRNAARVVIGNPAIADVTLQSPRDLVLFGKYPGGTTLLVADQDGKAIINTSILVTAAGDGGVTVHYGAGRTWTPGGTVSVVACGAAHCAPAMPLPPPQASSSVAGK